ncbi:uncharacterized protein LOC115449798 [Manduca sexta]|uniref:uncharacterized protein LOC115449798 n=1 Tax=Manduca sexta TaxID=7130 RepID=UPI00188F01EC|nr:uncharacterized protein LOC115449798 [Manduca sexta]
MFGRNSGEDDDEPLGGVYENGHWVWDDKTDELKFISNISLDESSVASPLPQVFKSIEFKDDLDLIEQQRFRKKYQRKYGADDVVTLQDVKDVVLFTAPVKILTPAVINILHLQMTDRFLRALILYCQYYLQICDEMAKRCCENGIKIRTAASQKIEIDFRENLEDLRLLVAKEYCSIIMGGGEFAAYHHMGLSKKLRSLSKRDSVLFETILRISIQIVWLTLGRKSFNQIELEIHRIFKSQIFNVVEHRLNTKFEANMSPEERFVLLGHCVHQESKLKATSPLLNETKCARNVDYRIFGLGIIKYSQLPQRLRYLERILISPEIMFPDLGFSLGIIGMPRCQFDTMLREIKIPHSTASSSTASFRHSVARMGSRTSRSSASGAQKSIAGALQQNIFKDITLPESEKQETLPAQFPTEAYPRISNNEWQRHKWLNRSSRINIKNKRKNKDY